MTGLALAPAATRSDDLADFEQIVRCHERQVLVTALRLLGNIGDAQDASQEVFLRLYRNLHRVDDPRNCPAWLYRVTVNVCRDVLRKRPAEAALSDGPELVAVGPDPLAAMTQAERRHALAQLLRRLPEKERAALVLRDLEGLSTREVAAALGSSEATVRSQVSKARAKIRESMERFLGRQV